jgi:hypothetical protein
VTPGDIPGHQIVTPGGAPGALYAAIKKYTRSRNHDFLLFFQDPLASRTVPRPMRLPCYPWRAGVRSEM